MRIQRWERRSRIGRFWTEFIKGDPDGWIDELEPSADELRLMLVYERHRFDRTADASHYTMGLVTDVFLAGAVGVSPEQQYRIDVGGMLRVLAEGYRRRTGGIQTETERRLKAKGILLTVTLALALLFPPDASDDLQGSRRMARDNARCHRMGERYEHHGLTDRERWRLERRHCVRDDRGWYSGLFYTAGE